MQNKRLIIIALVVVVLLLIPLIAMQFTDEVHWTLFDFFAAGILLAVTGLMGELVMRKVKTFKLRIVLYLVLLLVLFLVWAELAVGIFGSRFGGQ